MTGMTCMITMNRMTIRRNELEGWDDWDDWNDLHD